MSFLCNVYKHDVVVRFDNTRIVNVSFEDESTLSHVDVNDFSTIDDVQRLIEVFYAIALHVLTVAKKNYSTQCFEECFSNAYELFFEHRAIVAEDIVHFKRAISYKESRLSYMTTIHLDCVEYNDTDVDCIQIIKLLYCIQDCYEAIRFIMIQLEEKLPKDILLDHFETTYKQFVLSQAF